jgi:hypothetical protein
LKLGGAEERANDRQLPKPGQLLLVLVMYASEQPRDRKALPVAYLDSLVSPPGIKHWPAVHEGCDIAHLRFQSQVDETIFENSRSEIQLDPELLEGRRRPAVACWNVIGNLTTGQEACVFAGHRNEVWLGKPASEALLLKGLDKYVGLDARPKN